MNMKTIGISVGVLALLGIICAAGIPLLLSDSRTSGDPLLDDRSDLTGGMKSASAVNLTYTISTAFPSTPETVVLYRVVTPEITAELVSSMAGKMVRSPHMPRQHAPRLLDGGEDGPGRDGARIP
jgi:hypothetical protein